MNTARTYSEEALLSLFNELKEQNGQILDIVNLLLMSADEGEKYQKAILLGLEGIQQTTDNIDSKIDIVLDKLSSLENDFSVLKTEQRDLEQKITLMISKLSKLENSITDEDIEDYRVLAESLYTNWDDLDSLTKRFIPLAEYLYSKLQKYESADYSPVILELCRAIENEFLLKIFRKYTLDLISRQGRNLSGFLFTDKSDSNLATKTSQFVKAITKASKTNKPEYTLGQMNTILSLLKNDLVVDASPLLQDFKGYLETHTEVSSLLDPGYIQKINDIVNKYRNPSAHPDFMSIQKANECREVMPDRIDYLMDCVS